MSIGRYCSRKFSSLLCNFSLPFNDNDPNYSFSLFVLRTGHAVIRTALIVGTGVVPSFCDPGIPSLLISHAVDVTVN